MLNVQLHTEINIEKRQTPMLKDQRNFKTILHFGFWALVIGISFCIIPRDVRTRKNLSAAYTKNTATWWGGGTRGRLPSRSECERFVSEIEEVERPAEHRAHSQGKCGDEERPQGFVAVCCFYFFRGEEGDGGGEGEGEGCDTGGEEGDGGGGEEGDGGGDGGEGGEGGGGGDGGEGEGEAAKNEDGGSDDGNGRGGEGGVFNRRSEKI